jgi:hypothetical protein
MEPSGSCGYYNMRNFMFYSGQTALFGSKMNLISVWLDWGKQGITQNSGGEILERSMKFHLLSPAVVFQFVM